MLSNCKEYDRSDGFPHDFNEYPFGYIHGKMHGSILPEIFNKLIETSEHDKKVLLRFMEFLIKINNMFFLQYDQT